MIRLLAASAILSAATVYTADQPPIEDGTVLIQANRIEAVGKGVAVPANADVIDAKGMIVTPGFIDASSRLGLVEVSLEPTAVEGTAGSEADPIRAALRVQDTFNPASTAIPVARGGGLTSAVVVPSGGLISGQSAWVDLVEDSPVRRAPLALHVSLLGGGSEAGSRSRKFMRLREALDEARLFRGNRGPYIARRLRDLSVSAADLEVLAAALEGELPVVFEVDRAPDIETALQIIRDYRLGGVLLGAAEGWVLSDDIARARVPVFVDPLEDLPYRFGALRSRSDNGLLLHNAGVRVGFTLRDEAHRAHRLRQAAGNAVANGYPYDAAIEAITRVPADVFGLVDTGRIAPGALANVVVWNGDPFEVTTWPVHLIVRGREIPLRTRQDLLTERYLAP